MKLEFIFIKVFFKVKYQKLFLKNKLKCDVDKNLNLYFFLYFLVI